MMKDPYLIRVDCKPLWEPKTLGEAMIYTMTKRMESIQHYINYANGKQDIAKYKKQLGFK